MTDRDVFIRNHVMGVLVFHQMKGLNYTNMGELADAITEAVIIGDIAWEQQRCCEQILQIEEDVPL